jgi:hypothetical protein
MRHLVYSFWGLSSDVQPDNDVQNDNVMQNDSVLQMLLEDVSIDDLVLVEQMLAEHVETYVPLETVIRGEHVMDAVDRACPNAIDGALESSSPVDRACPNAIDGALESSSPVDRACPNAIDGALESSSPGTIDGALELSPVDGACPNAIDGALESSSPVVRAWPNAIDRALESSSPGTIDGALVSPVDRACPNAIDGESSERDLQSRSASIDLAFQDDGTPHSERSSFIEDPFNCIIGMECEKLVIKNCVLDRMLSTVRVAVFHTARFVLLHGPPGTGKSLFASSMISYVNQNYRDSVFCLPYKNQQSIELAIDRSPAIILVDESDEKIVEIVNLFRRSDLQDVTVIFTIQSIQLLSREFLCRVDFTFFFPLPDFETRRQIVEKVCHPTCDSYFWAQRGVGCSHRNIFDACKTAIVDYFFQQQSLDSSLEKYLGNSFDYKLVKVLISEHAWLFDLPENVLVIGRGANACRAVYSMLNVRAQHFDLSNLKKEYFLNSCSTSKAVTFSMYGWKDEYDLIFETLLLNRIKIFVSDEFCSSYATKWFDRIINVSNITFTAECFKWLFPFDPNPIQCNLCEILFKLKKCT